MAILAADKKDIRDHIRGVYLEASAKELRFTATNGVVMGVYRIEQDNPDITETIKCIIPAELIAGIKGKDNVLLTISEPLDEHRLQRKLTLAQSWAMQSMQSVSRTYPDYRRTIPATTSGEPAQFDPDLLIRLKKFGKALQENKGYFAIAYNGESAAIADFHLGNLLVIIMPLRKDEKTYADPESPAWSREFI
jgi:hypothetical protein